jgi:arylsulfatase A-like enzyme
MSKDFGFHRGFDEFAEWGNGIALKRNQALKWLDGLPEGRRFFCFVHCFDIHAPYAPPPKYRDLFGGGNPSRIEPRASADLLRRIREIIPAGAEGGAGEKPVLSDDDRRRVSDLYDAGIRYTDDQLDLFFKALEERGLLGRTVVVVLADHGEEFWDHGSVLHGHTLYQELTRVPLVIRVPGLAPRRVAERVALLDLLPTLLELLGVEPAAGAQGVSLVPLVRGDAAVRGGPPLLSEGMESGHYALIDGGYKLIRRPDRRQYELYHIEEDPLETVDLARREPERVARMSQVMRQHHQALAALPRPRPPKAARPGETLDPRTEERLRQLGYLEPDEK